MCLFVGASGRLVSAGPSEELLARGPAESTINGRGAGKCVQRPS